MKRTLLAGLVGSALLVGVVGLCGCSRQATPGGGDQEGDKGPERDPQALLEQARDRLHRGTTAGAEEQLELVGARDAVEQLNAYLKALGKEPPFRLTDRERARLKGQFHLDDAELTEVANPNFTPLDAHYLGFCFQLAEVARSLDAQGLSPVDRARIGFAWVARQVSLLERYRQDGFTNRDDDLLPPPLVLQIGHGSDRERALLFFDLLQQLGIDGCMVAFPDEDGKLTPWVPGVLIGRPEKGAAGAAAAPGIYLFDTRLGLPLPGPGGKGVARLEDVARDPKAYRAIFPRDAARIVPDGVKRAEILLPCPLSALSPRMKFLQKQIATAEPVVLAVDPDALRERFRKAAGARKVRFWSAAGDRNTPTRVLRSNLPPSSGGTDKQNRWSGEMHRLIPWPLIHKGYPEALQPPLYSLLDQRQLLPFFLNAILKPRGQMLRGRFDQATKLLVSAQDTLNTMGAAYREETRDVARQAQLRKEVNDWCQNLADAQVAVNRAEDAAREGGGPAADRQLQAAKKQLATLFQSDRLLDLIVYQAVAEPLGKESTYLLCLCMHEKAERMQNKRDRAGGNARGAVRAAAGAWASAGDWWGVYLARFGLTGDGFDQRLKELKQLDPRARQDLESAATVVTLYRSLALDLDRTLSARRLLARAQQQAGQAPAARETLENQARELEQWARGGELEGFKQFAGDSAAFRLPGTVYPNPATLTWLRAGVLTQLELLKRQ